MTDDGAAPALHRIFREYGPEVVEEPLRLESLLRDLAAPHKREVFLLVQALRVGVVTALRDVRPPMSAGLVAQQGVRKLQDDLGLAPAWAEWAVHTWADVLAVPGIRQTAAIPPPESPAIPPPESPATPNRAQRRRKALREVNDYLERNPDDAAALGMRADLERMLGRDDAALATAEAALALNPASAVALRVRGEIRRRRGQLDEALEDLNRSLGIEPESPQSLVSRGETYRDMDRIDAAESDLDDAIALAPSSAAYAARAALYARQDRHQDALEDCKRALMWDSADVDATLRSRIQRMQKVSIGAVNVLQRSRAIAPAAREWARRRMSERWPRRADSEDDQQDKGDPEKPERTDPMNTGE